MKKALLILASLLIHGAANAEIYKLAVPTDQGMMFYWWPVLPIISGWAHDEGASRAQSVNALVPTGYSFSQAPAVIYARAMYKPRMPETKSLSQLIADDRATFESEFSGVKINELTPIIDGNHKALRYFSYTPASQGSWELVAYGEEGEIYLIFTVSGNTEAALLKARPDFEKIVSTYK